MQIHSIIYTLGVIPTRYAGVNKNKNYVYTKGKGTRGKREY